jgi:hypothetical protein
VTGWSTQQPAVLDLEAAGEHDRRVEYDEYTEGAVARAGRSPLRM